MIAELNSAIAKVFLQVRSRLGWVEGRKSDRISCKLGFVPGYVSLFTKVFSRQEKSRTQIIKQLG